MSENLAYNTREWDSNPAVDWNNLDEDAFDEAKEAYPFDGLPLQGLRSDVIERYLTQVEPSSSP